MGRWANKYVIGLTGNIAMGKSLVRKMLENLGAYTIDADGLAHQAMAPGAPAYGPVVDHFGKWILDADRKIDRAKLGAVVFSHNEALNLLEKLTHPIVGQAIDILISRAKQPVVVVEAIKLVDGILGSQVDSVWVVDATPEVQIQRLMNKRNMPEWEARKRIETQNPQPEKLKRANVVITNNGSPEEVWTQVQREWNRVTGKAEETPAAVPATSAPAARPPSRPSAPPPPLPEPAQTMPPLPQAVPMPQVRPSTPSVPPTVSAPPPPAAAPAQAVASTPAAPVDPRRTTGSLAMPLGTVTSVDVRPGMPKNADSISRLLTQYLGRAVTRSDVMMAFGEKAYRLAEANGRSIGITGFQVENLITRVDEFYVIPEAPLGMVSEKLIHAVEEASKELQSEVGFVFLSRSASDELVKAFLDQGYEQITIESLKVPAWREAAQELQTPDRQLLMKKLRAERVLKPV